MKNDLTFNSIPEEIGKRLLAYFEVGVSLPFDSNIGKLEGDKVYKICSDVHAPFPFWENTQYVIYKMCGEESLMEILFDEISQKISLHVIAHVGEKQFCRIKQISDNAFLIDFTVCANCIYDDSHYPYSNIGGIDGSISIHKLVRNGYIKAKETTSKISPLIKETINKIVATLQNEFFNKGFQVNNNAIMKRLLMIVVSYVYPSVKFPYKAFSALNHECYELNDKSVSSGGLFLLWNYLDWDDPIFTTNSYVHLINDVYIFALKKTANDILNFVKSSLTHSAVGSIMSRNGSHNIGSHVLASLTHDSSTMPADQILDQYIQHRMDYIATATTAFPSWHTPMRLIADVMKNFLNQKHLLEYISKSEGLGAYLFNDSTQQENKIKFFVRRLFPAPDPQKGIIYPTNNLWGIASVSDSKETHFFTYEPQSSIPLNQDCVLAIKGGIIGQHAFFTILENIIRNSAKHGWAHNASYNKSSRMLGNLEIHIDFIDNPLADAVEFTVWDNVSDVMANLKKGEDWNYIALQELLDVLKLAHTKEVEWIGIESKKATDPTEIEDWKKLLEKAKDHQKRYAEREQAYGKTKNDEQLKNALQKYNWEDFHYSLSFYELLCMQEKIKEKHKKGEQLLLPLHWQQQLRMVEPFISETGELRKEFWGLAEMKISAGFLQGNNISQIGGLDKSYANSLKSIILPIAMAQKDAKVGEVHWHLGYRFRIPKPKEILLEIEKSKNSKEISGDVKIKFRKHGIYLKTKQEINDSKDFGYSFVVLKEVETVNTWKTSMPLRLLTYGKKCKKCNHNMIVYCQGLSKSIDDLYGKQKVDKSEIVQIRDTIYKSWLDYFKTRRGIKDIINVQLYLYEDKNSSEDTSDLWATVLDTMLPVFEPNSFSEDKCIQFKSWLKTSNNLPLTEKNIKTCLEEFCKKEDININIDYTPYDLIASYKTLKRMYEKAQDTLPPGYMTNDIKGNNTETSVLGVRFHRVRDNDKAYHIIGKRHDSGVATPNITKYQEALSGEQSYFSQIVQLYNNASENVEFAVRFVESALMRVLLIDERVCEYMEKSNSDKFLKQGIWAINTTKFFKDLQITANGGSAEIGYHVKNCEESALLEFDPAKFNNFRNGVEKNSNEAYDSEKFKIFNNFDMIIIHQGMIDKCLPSKSPKSIERFLKWLKGQCPYVIVTTGRGTPANIPSTARILPFASIQSTLLKNNPEKLVLVNTVMNVLTKKSENGVTP